MCGGRDYRDEARVSRVLDQLVMAMAESGEHLSCIIHGDAPGADTLANNWAKRRGIPIEKFPANWKRYGRGAGPRRNARMIAEGLPELAIAFPGGRGTADMVSKCHDAWVSVTEVPR
ncbi:hypothetical protein LCGC14_2851900 [marine sediment metagenome]|uniref:YspA cpYpsA-related SLOG domain-containing protein n=1 Tax=marine sediment metagenome TaxID=412755 RepID=A0A0F8YUY7_9ZZZZ